MEAGRAPSGRVAAERLNSEPRADLQSPSSGLYRCKFAAAKVDTVREAVERGRIGDYIQVSPSLFYFSPSTWLCDAGFFLTRPLLEAALHSFTVISGIVAPLQLTKVL